MDQKYFFDELMSHDLFSLGLDPKVMTSILNTSTGRCWSSEIYPPVPGIIDTVPSSNDYQVNYSLNYLIQNFIIIYF